MRTPLELGSRTKLSSLRSDGVITINGIVDHVPGTSDHIQRNTQDAENRLIAVKQGTTTLASFIYDGRGRRYQKVAGNVTRTYIQDGNEIAEERLSTGGAIRYFHGLGIDRVLASQDPAGVTTFYVADHVGNIRQSTNTIGAVTLTRDYDPYGNLLAGSTTSGYAFTGREWDAESNLYYYRARYYSSILGRFVSEDPRSFYEGANFYRYADNNPITRLDPFGLAVKTIGCGADTARVQKAAADAEAGAKTCLKPKTECDEFIKFVRELEYECVPWTKSPELGIDVCSQNTGSRIQITPDGLNDSICGCLKGTIFHEVLHSLGKTHDAPGERFKAELGCFKCAK